jgi:hypothetical protein
MKKKIEIEINLKANKFRIYCHMIFNCLPGCGVEKGKKRGWKE